MNPQLTGLVRDCLTWIRTTDYVSFAELEHWLADRGIETKGDWTLEPARNLLIWAGISGQFRDIFHAMRPHLDLEPCTSLLVYLADGKMLNLPIAKRLPENGYREPHWLPVTMRTKQRATKAEIRAALIEDAAERTSP